MEDRADAAGGLAGFARAMRVVLPAQRNHPGVALHARLLAHEPPKAGEYPAASFVAEAARDFGFAGDEIRLALSHAEKREGRRVGRMDVAVEVAVAAGGGRLEAGKLLAAARSEAVAARIDASTQEFFSHRISQRPAFVLEDAIGDKVVFSGLTRIEPIAATIDAMLADCAAYASFRAHFGDPPAV